MKTKNKFLLGLAVVILTLGLVLVSSSVSQFLPAQIGGDIDGDGILDTQDNCPTVPNPNQENDDGDAYG
ncbi:MAG TPA: hypothetical protein ENI70_00520, partial [Candidatus Peregrinibacteria bacterium]|nr:hypothetical protein [Candidatus Peregrinibacteria bacterium]